MAEIWVDRKCLKCGKQVPVDEKAVLVATVRTSQNESYGGYGKGRKRKVRINFYANSPRALMHVECAEE